MTSPPSARTRNPDHDLDAEFDASPDRVWQLWADPRQLERWWGPADLPATVTAHDLRSGGRVDYHMTGPRVTSRTATGRSSRPMRPAGSFSRWFR
jgi:uncharacterized protein YndB with AHSA1/START domain